MQAFERFTVRARRALALAQQEAELAARQSLAEALSAWVASWAATPPGG